MSSFHLSTEDKKILLQIARSSIEMAMKGLTLPEYEPESSHLKEARGAFVTLEIESNLRGCIGSMESEQPLYKTVSEMAISAAFRDPRFPPLGEEELEKVQIEISVLSPLISVESEDEIEVGKHGLMIRKGFYSGVLLPQVASRYGWTREEFLRQTCLKAGLYEDAWKEADCEIWIFSALIFGEGKHCVDYERENSDN
ncbi:MAG: AmmeMemoRadiSam system protein A [Candidatus Glassbacteria bacterium]